MIIASRIGGTSGPLWGTAFLRAGAAAGSADDLSGAQVVAMLRAAIEGIKARGSPTSATRRCWTRWSR
jgi:dihydroxyacetone kinase-like protein